ncbi:ATP-dependent helicase/nuclease subunit B [Pseudobutyrivibrio sp. YE44]|uniref:PD-(D/E)XK nuclease family protein n=1 Tax=Pseudobutyrivibrio sp. YE44 TaxID=1520802 RepID=UPI0008838FC3|nr:PD-(D/E)XK nuclease family protein [Pseudobutyrivibrio sp. YE44]SDB33124.1 ATP-dependent helicase/nuclease subunit B [Pseudobutyrivibrio sp. YE44]
MSLSLIVGSSGSGKSTSIYNRIIKESIENKDKNFLIIVPEQYTMSTQRLLVSMHPNHCIMNIDVLSFNRLAYRVFEELGAAVHAVLDDTGKSLVIRKLVENHLDEMGALKGNIKRINYITQVKSLISEMTQYNITPERLQEMIDTPTMSRSFKERASDLLVLYRAFLEFIDGKYVTTESILSTLNSMLDDSNIVLGSTVVLDGFTGFTPIQYQLVEHMLKICDEVAVTITADENTALFQTQAEDELFAMSSEFALKMEQLAKKVKVEINEPVFIDSHNGWLSSNDALQFLEQNIFRDEKKSFQGQNPDQSIKMVSLRSPRQELKYIAITINKLVRDGMRYKDIAVVAPNLEQYRYLLTAIWSDYKIPYFIDAKTEILFHPMCEAIDSIFDIWNRNFRREDVIRFLKTGLTDLSTEDIDYLENYLIATGIRGANKYFHPFAIRANSFSKDEDMLRVNDIRNRFIGSFMEFDKAVGKKSSVRQLATALYQLIVTFDFESKINKRGQEYEDSANSIKAKEYSQIYPVIMNILDKMVSILDDEVMDLEEFHDIYKAGLSAATIGVIPPANDSVIVGDIERTRLANIKVLFCIGASDDAIPMKVENGGILSQLEREQLLNAGFELAPSDRQRAFRQKFYLYLMLTKPNQKLYLTLPRVDGEGKGVNPSYLTGIIKQLFPSIKLEEIEEFQGHDRLLSKKSAVDFMITLLSKAVLFGMDNLSEQELTLLNSLLTWAKQDEEVDLEQIIKAAFFEHEKEAVSKDIMLAVNEAFHSDETVSGSVSKFELYNECAYKYFLRYILKLQEREEFELSNIDLGNFCHEALQRYSDSLKEDNKSWKTVTKKEQDSYITTAISQTFEAMPKVQTLEDSTQKYIVNTMKKTLHYTIDVITTQVRRGEFEPAFFEENIQSQIVDPITKEIVADFTGKVDRIDLTDSEDKAVRIIDYKSSGRQLSLAECYYGISMQLPIYMGVVIDKLKDKYPSATLHPAAMLYYKMTNEFIKNDGYTEADLKEMRLRTNKMEGLLSSDENDLRANDATVGLEEEQTLKSSIVPYEVTTKGALSSRTNAVARSDMQTVIDYSMQTAANTAKKILAGEFDCEPVKVKNKIDACQYCGYKSICHFNEDAEGFNKKELQELGSSKNDEIIELMKQALNQDEKLDQEGDEASGAN